MGSSSRQKWFYILIVLSMCAWGGSWITAKWTSGYPAESTSFWRFAVTALSFIPILIWRKESFALPAKAWLWVGLSACALAAYNIVFLRGLHSGGGGYGGVLVPTLSPQFNFLIALVVLRQPIARIQRTGLFLGFTGGLLQILGPGMHWQSFARPENIFFITAAFSYAVLTHFGVMAQKSVSVFRYSFWLYVFSTVLILPFTLPTGPFNLGQFRTDFWINVFYLALMAGTFGTTFYFEAARQLGAARAGSFGFLVPVSAVILAFIFLGEHPAWTSILGGALSVTAVYLIQRKPRQA